MPPRRYDEGQSINKKYVSLFLHIIKSLYKKKSSYNGSVSFYFAIGVVNTETYEALLCSGSLIERHVNMCSKNDQVSLSSVTVINIRFKIRVRVYLEMTRFNPKPDMISPESLEFCIDQDFFTNVSPSFLVTRLILSGRLRVG